MYMSHDGLEMLDHWKVYPKLNKLTMKLSTVKVSLCEKFTLQCFLGRTLGLGHSPLLKFYEGRVYTHRAKPGIYCMHAKLYLYQQNQNFCKFKLYIEVQNVL